MITVSKVRYLQKYPVPLFCEVRGIRIIIYCCSAELPKGLPVKCDHTSKWETAEHCDFHKDESFCSAELPKGLPFILF